MSEFADACVKQMREAMSPTGPIGKTIRRAEKAVFTNNPSPKLPVMPCPKCGGRLSVQMPDYYAGYPSCNNCRYYPSLDELQAWDDQHRPEYERLLAEWDNDWSIKP